MLTALVTLTNKVYIVKTILEGNLLNLFLKYFVFIFLSGTEEVSL